QILETAQLGPKRQLVVARVNGETMILGSSEAGITCLSGLHRLPPMPPMPQMSSEGTLSGVFNMYQLSQMNQMGQIQMPQMPQANQMGQRQMPQANQPPQFAPFDPPPHQQATGNEFVDEGGLLTRLFRARG